MEQMGTPDKPVDWRNAQAERAFQNALDALKNEAFLKSPRYQEQQTRANLAGAHPDIVEFSRKVVKKAKSLGVPLFAHCIVRTKEEQAIAFGKGVSWDSPDDGLWPHRFAAVDIIHGTRGWIDSPKIPNAWAVIGHLGKEVANSMDLPVVWGGDWKSKWDPAHWELRDWRDMDPYSFKLKER